MMNIQKQPKLNFTIYLIISQIFLNFILLNNLSISYFPKWAFIVPIILSLFTIFFSMFLPIRNVSPSTFIKVLSSLYYIVFNILILLTCAYILNFYFYQKTSFFLLTFLLSLIILLLTEFSSKHIYDISLTLFIFTISLNLIMILNTSYGNIDLLLNIDFSNLINRNIVFMLLLLFITLDPINFYFTNIIDNNVNLKKSIIISSIISTIVSCFTIFINYLYYSYSYLKETMFPAFSFISSFLGPEFLDYFTIIILINTLVFSLLKVALNFSFIKQYYNKFKFSNVFFVSITFIIINVIFKYSYLNILKFEYFGFILTVIITIIYLNLVFKKEVKKDATTET